MGLTTLTESEKRWRRIAKRAVEQGEEWEPCPECLRYHPAGAEVDCKDPATQLPTPPDQLVG